MKKIVLIGSLFSLLLAGLYLVGCGDQAGQDIPAILKVAGQTPALNATEVELIQDLNVTFNFPIDTNSFSLNQLFNFGPKHTAGAPDLSAVQASWSSDKKTLTVSGIKGWANLVLGGGQKVVEITAKEGAIVDLFRNELKENTVLWSFTLGALGVSTTNPTSAQTAVPTNATIQAKFGIDMNPSTINTTTFTVWGSQVLGSVNYDEGTRTATFTPNQRLEEQHTYVATIDGTVRTFDGEQIGTDYTWEFITADETPPTIVGFYPASGATNVGSTAEITVTFSETMDATSFNANTFYVESGGSKLTSVITFDATGKQAILRVQPSMQNSSNFDAVLTTGVKDPGGNSPANGQSWSFSTSSPHATLYFAKNGGGPIALFGLSVDGAGDTNSDGYDDVIVGAPKATSYSGADNSGRAYVYSGADASALFADDGANEYFYGAKVIGAGDVDNDNYSDLAIGAPNYNNGVGRLYVYSGVDGTIRYWADGPAASPIKALGLYFGFSISLAAIGDLNGDGNDDIAVGSWYQPGQVFVYSGNSAVILATIEAATSDDESFGASVTGPGDLNGDGIPEIIIGAPYATVEGDAYRGRVFVYSGATMTLLYPSLEGEAAGDVFGYALATLGDINGDGINDFIVGAADALQLAGNGAEKAYVYSGATGSLLTSFSRETAGTLFGGSVGGCGDVNGDDVPDVIIGAAGFNAGLGKAYIYSGANSSLLYSIEGQTTAAYSDLYFGASVSGAGDVNNDGKADFVIGSSHATVNGVDRAGKAYVFISQ